MHPTFDPDALRPGDVLLMKGIGAVSDLIAWFGDSTYSHAAIVVDDGMLVEAASPRSRRVSVAARLGQGAYYDFVDAFRPTRHDGTPTRPADRTAAVVSAQTLLEVPYALDGLLQMAVFAALRDRIPTHAGVRWIIRVLIDHLVEDDPSQMVCSELVYRALDGATTAPEHLLRPKVIVSAMLDAPFPTVDWIELWQEFEQARRSSVALAGRVAPVVPAASTASPDALESPTVSDPDLLECYARLRDTRAARAPGLLSAPVDPNPNPKLVMPVDLETSPSLRRLGRLPLTEVPSTPAGDARTLE